MIRQHVYCWNDERFGTAAISPGPEGSISQDRLEQAVRLCAASNALPVYFQYPLDGGVVVGRCGVAEENGEEYHLAHQLIAQSPEDVALLMHTRPLDCDRYLSSLSGVGETLPCLDAAALFDGEALNAAFHALDVTFGLRAEPLAALLAAARQLCAGECRQALVLMPGQEAEVTRLAQQIMELVTRCLPLEEGAALRWSSLPPGERFAANGLCFAAKESYRLAPLERRVNVLIDLEGGIWENLPRPADAQEVEAARALLAHDLYWIDRVFHAPERAVPVPPTDRLPIELPPFEAGMSVKQYFSDWTEALLSRRALLNNEAFAEFARGEWERLTDRLVAAAECTPSRQYMSDMQQIIQALRRREYAARLGMAAESLVDLVALLLDDLSWDEVNLADEQDVQTLQRLSLYAHSLDEESLSQIRTGRGLLVFYALLGHEDQATLRALEAMEALCREDSAQFDQVQAMLRGYVLSRCRADSLPLGRDDRFVVCSMLAYVRFVDGVPDLRRLNALEQLIRQNCGERAMRHYEARLDDQRRRMSSHSIRRAKKNRWLFALYALLGLGAVGGAVLLVLRFIR